MKFFLFIKNKVRNFPLRFFPWDLIEEGITEKTPGKEGFLIQSNDSFPQKLSQLKHRTVLQDQDDSAFFRVIFELYIPGKNDSFLFTSQPDQFTGVLSAIIEGIITQHP